MICPGHILVKCYAWVSKNIFVFIFQGYQGLVDGGDNIKEVTWEEMSGIIQQVCLNFKLISGSLHVKSCILQM